MKGFLFFFIEKILFPTVCFFVPVHKEILLFGSGFNRFADNPKFLFLHFQNDSFYEPIWVSPNRSEVKELRENGYTSVYKWSLGTLWIVFRASIWFVSHKGSDVFPFIPGRTTLINLWHGTPIKNIGFDSLKEGEWIQKFLKSGRKLPYERWDYFITASENTNFIFKSAMRLKEDNIKALGQPRNQPIYMAIDDKEICKAIEDKNPILKKLKGIKKLLYTPTFRNNSFSTDKIKDTLIRMDETLKTIENQFLLFKPHPLDRRVFDDPFFEKLTNVIDVSSLDTQELLCVSDVLITDYSSVIFDFMITGRPIIAYVFDMELYVQENGGLYFSFTDLGANLAKDESELFDLVLNNDTLSNDYDSLHFNTPESSVRIAKFIKGLS